MILSVIANHHFFSRAQIIWSSIPMGITQILMTLLLVEVMMFQDTVTLFATNIDRIMK
ncbi:hypothetical protein [Enterococcus gilvus]|uniref:hypothetical protein n=1 Tax=Enterococcus gilvus TaxID=160453 RepID=UPI0014721E41|nr:hypothetical protein [Enterococcus gilvus]